MRTPGLGRSAPAVQLGGEQIGSLGEPPGGGGFTSKVFGDAQRPKHPSKSGMKSKPHRQGDRQIDFSKCRVVIFLFHFFVEGRLLNFINCNPDVLVFAGLWASPCSTAAITSPA